MCSSVKSFLFVAVLIFSDNKLFANNSIKPLAVEIKLLKSYDKKVAKNDIIWGLEEYRYEITEDTVVQKKYDIEISIKNTSKCAAYICMMKCSWNESFLVNNDYMFME